ncbi:GNAT family N-acetyltransferase [Cryobacterium sp. TMT1-21]|uniref:GNAT family N-acetyltransferase n=1 Tax=Cryobacterium shii TaxID=1259235 RepID=A0AAQ2C6D0_9MICO|nr:MULTISPECIES: GNAT family N-acetyltransferase [Cryobacterium]TFC47081.1 GNAT family N-acetyltransferase [Cryobacterium shii]TFC88186.1 GNAT family N-acetyltransferase [Cryobacterium sp. TmT2-59]TFD13066.1 GNAT family N-acetyltransferase [Cryobacterium sp. TMT4-10]TFD13840.1 GNAT family N-acetyltransferase [Cryobacterium sp. TMT1-21]TFD16993.1 GNAT family N-acetyltransferase [Cryobacterium sp. TMT2-23]
MVTTAVIRPVEEADAESLGRVHATCWHETYDQLLSTAALEQLQPARLAAMWRRFSSQGPQYRQVAALVDGEIVGFAGSGPARDTDKPAPQELYFIYLLDAYHGTGIGQQLFDAVVDEGPSYLWVAEVNPRAHSFYKRNGYAADGHDQDQEVLGEELHEVRLVRPRSLARRLSLVTSE